MPIYFRLSSYNLPLSLESIGNRWNQESVFRPSGFPLYHWLQTEKGCGRVSIDNKKIELSKGEGLLISPLIPHSYSNISDEWLTSFATFTGSLNRDIHKIVGQRPFTYVPADNGEFYWQWIDKIISLHEFQMLDAIKLSEACYSFLISFNCRKQCQSHNSHPLYHQYIEPALEQIEINYSQPLTVQNISALLYISPQYLNRLFKRFIGCSVYTYLLILRIDKAKELLINYPNLEIQQIAHRVGFQDHSHFTAIFKKITGVTPLCFRKIH